MRLLSAPTDVLDLARQYGHIEDLASIAGFNLFASGIGLDRISDILYADEEGPDEPDDWRSR